MQRHQRNAPSRVRLGTLIVGIALSLMMFGMSPAQAATGGIGQISSTAQVGRPAVKAKVVQRTTVPKWVSGSNTTQVKLPGTSNVSVDWQWLKGGWEIKFSKSETITIAAGAGACSTLLSKFGHPVFKVLSAGCGLLAVYAGYVRAKGRCLSAWVPVSLFTFSVGSWGC